MEAPSTSTDSSPRQSSAKMEKSHENQYTVSVNNLEKGQTTPHDIVTWDDDHDPQNPLNFSKAVKWWTVFVISSAAICTTTCSSIIAMTFPAVQQEFRISPTVATLGITLFIAGLGLGPLYMAPLSEFFGRNLIFRISFFFFVVLNIPVALAKNAETWLVFRFLTGIGGSAFLSVAGGTVSDMFTGPQISTPMMVYTASPFLGPVIGPIIGGFINQHTNWRWTWYVQIIWSFVELCLLMTIPETFAPVLLKKKAANLRKTTGNADIKCHMEVKPRSMRQVIFLSCTIPFKLVASEPMALLLNIWTSMYLAVLYMFFPAFPIVFSKHGFNMQEQGLAFLGIGIGILIAVALNPLFVKQQRRVAKRLGTRTPPEIHLIKAMWAALMAPAALFWFAFTTYTSIHWIVPIIASIPFGTSIILAYSGTFTFLVDAYRPYAASALASNSFFRSAFAAAFPLFARPMYAKLGTDWASALCGFIILSMAPFPFLFYKYGARLRKGSKYATPPDS